MFPWNKMFPFPKEHMKEDIFKQTDIEKWMGKAMQGRLPATPQSLQSADFFAQSFDLLRTAQYKKKKKSTSLFEVNVFETHEEVFIRFAVSSEELLAQMITYYNATTCFIEDYPQKGNKHAITLPSLVKSNSSKARYKNGILEISIPKETNTPFTKVPIEVIKDKRNKK